MPPVVELGSHCQLFQIAPLITASTKATRSPDYCSQGKSSLTSLTTAFRHYLSQVGICSGRPGHGLAGAVIAERFNRSPRWGRLVKMAGVAGSLDDPRADRSAEACI
jgi:hypothetical protein